MRSYLSTVTKAVALALSGALLIAGFHCGELRITLNDRNAEAPSQTILAKVSSGATQI
jgi:hypothetical protein